MSGFSTSDLNRRSGELLAAAARRPVMITQRKKPRFVLLSIEDYNVLKTKGDTRRVGTLDTMSDELFAEVEAAYERYRDDGEEA